MITLTYKYKIKPTRRQIQELENYLDICRSVYNYAHRERVDWLNSRKSQIDRCSLISEYIIPVDAPFPGYSQQCKNLTQAKKSFLRLKEVQSQVLQQVLKRLDKVETRHALSLQGDFVKNGKGFPRFKSRNRFRSFVFPQAPKKILGARSIKLPKIGWVRIRKSRPYPTGFMTKQCRVVRRITGWFVMIYFQSDESIPDPLPGKTSLGIDAGDCFVASSSQRSRGFIATSSEELSDKKPRERSAAR